MNQEGNEERKKNWVEKHIQASTMISVKCCKTPANIEKGGDAEGSGTREESIESILINLSIMTDDY